MTPDQLSILVEKYLDGTATPDEMQVLHEWYRSAGMTEVVWPSDHPGEREHIGVRLLKGLQRDIRLSRSGKPGTWRPGAGIPVVPLWRNRLWMAAAVAGLILFSGAVYLWSGKHAASIHPAAVAKASPDDLLPGGNKAKLVLSDGRVLTLDSAGNGLLAEQGNAHVEKTAQGQLAYQAAKSGMGSGPGAGSTTTNAYPEIVYNTIITPQGGTFAVTLSDGTRVWLNAGSSLKYPAAFTGPVRSVELKGEGYFEVAPGAARPFSVISGGQRIEVLGTHFNINAYDNEPTVKTTLLQGSVKVVKGDKGALLQPGQQSIWSTAGGLTIRKDIDTAEVMAWKNGMFQFDAADIGTVMRQIGRWYDVNVVFEGKLPDDHFRGKIPRDVNASQVLQILALSGVDFRIEGKTIILK
jgi:transmembrane sensor